MELGLAGKVALVTGASSAIGKATALAFADEKARIAVGYHTNREAAEKTATMARQRGGHAIVWPLDLGQPSSLQRAVEHARRELDQSTSWSTTPCNGRPGQIRANGSRPRLPSGSAHR